MVAIAVVCTAVYAFVVPTRSDAASDSKHIDLTVDGDEDDAALARRLQRQYDRGAGTPSTLRRPLPMQRRPLDPPPSLSLAPAGEASKGVGGSASGGTSEQSGAKKRKSVLDMLKESRART